jgi:hypothetical protein
MIHSFFLSPLGERKLGKTLIFSDWEGKVEYIFEKSGDRVVLRSYLAQIIIFMRFFVI